MLRNNSKQSGECSTLKLHYTQKMQNRTSVWLRLNVKTVLRVTVLCGMGRHVNDKYNSNTKPNPSLLLSE